jgi:hypothetical protein
MNEEETEGGELWTNKKRTTVLFCQIVGASSGGTAQSVTAETEKLDF